MHPPVCTAFFDVDRSEIDRHRIKNRLRARHHNRSRPSGEGITPRLFVEIQQQTHRRTVGKETHNAKRHQQMESPPVPAPFRAAFQNPPEIPMTAARRPPPSARLRSAQFRSPSACRPSPRSENRRTHPVSSKAPVRPRKKSAREPSDLKAPKENAKNPLPRKILSDTLRYNLFRGRGFM